VIIFFSKGRKKMAAAENHFFIFESLQYDLEKQKIIES